MLTGIEDHEGIHFSTQIDVAAGDRILAGKLHFSISIDDDLTEKIYVRDEIDLPQSPLAEFNEKLVASVAVERVTLLLVAGGTVFRPDHRGRRMAGQRIVPSAGVLRNRAKYVAQIT